MEILHHHLVIEMTHDIPYALTTFDVQYATLLCDIRYSVPSAELLLLFDIAYDAPCQQYCLLFFNPPTTANFYTHPIQLESTLNPVCFLNILTPFCT